MAELFLKKTWQGALYKLFFGICHILLSGTQLSQLRNSLKIKDMPTPQFTLNTCSFSDCHSVHWLANAMHNWRHPDKEQPVIDLTNQPWYRVFLGHLHRIYTFLARVLSFLRSKNPAWRGQLIYKMAHLYFLIMKQENGCLGLEKWLNNQEHSLLFQTTQVQFTRTELVSSGSQPSV